MQNSLTHAEIGNFALQEVTRLAAAAEPKRLRLVWSSDVQPARGLEDVDGALAAIDDLLIL